LSLTVEVHRPTELDTEVLDCWRRFQADNPVVASPFLSPEFACAADRARPDVRVAVVSDGPAIVGFLPFSAGPLGLGAPVAPGFCDQQAVIHPAGPGPDLAAVLAGAGLHAFRFDHLLASQAPSRSGTAVVAGASSWLIELPDGWDGYRSWALANRKRYINLMQRKDRRFAVEHPDSSFSFDSRDPHDLAELLRLKTDQCRRRGWEDLFAARWRRQMVEELASTRTPTLAGTVSALRIGDRVVAADFSLRGQTIYAGWHIAFDAGYSQYSPGIVRWCRLIEAVAATGPVTIDLGKGADDFKERYSTSTLALAEGMLASTRAGRAAVVGQRAVAEGRKRLPGAETWLRASVQRWRRHRYGTGADPVEG
jgi:CelD/BcsL family acetyltransferase involved in cellulose biosynthesis